jgi:hypothetical protein
MPFVTLVPALVICLVAVVLAAVTWTLRRHRQNALLLRADWGQLRDRERDYPALLAFHHARKDDGPSIDDRTWEDLHLDSVFTVLDHTNSAIGQQALYHRLRTPFVGPTLTAFDALVNLIGQQTLDRERLQVQLEPLRDATAYDLWRCARPDTFEPPSTLAWFPLMTAGTLLALILTPIWPVAIVGAAAIATMGLIARATLARRLRLTLDPFRRVAPLFSAARTLDAIDLPGGESLIGTLRGDLSALSRLR